MRMCQPCVISGAVVIIFVCGGKAKGAWEKKEREREREEREDEEREKESKRGE